MSKFTFYADLVGMSSAYEASPDVAYELLNTYYNEVFHGLSAYYSGKAHRVVEMYSDSLTVTGDNLPEFLCTLSPVYMKLLSKGLLLRGGIASGPLDFDVRLTAANFQKKLPATNIIARCVALERKTKGARLAIESSLARELLAQHQEWLTLSGYALNPRKGESHLILQRAIVPLLDGTAFEVLYPVLAEEEPLLIDRRIQELEYLSQVLPRDVSIHHTETKRLLEHSKLRLEHQRA